MQIELSDTILQFSQDYCANLRFIFLIRPFEAFSIPFVGFNNERTSKSFMHERAFFYVRE